MKWLEITVSTTDEGADIAASRLSMLGLNEIWAGPEEVAANYKELLDQIREAAPDALIFIQANLYVSASYAEDEPLLTSSLPFRLILLWCRKTKTSRIWSPSLCASLRPWSMSSGSASARFPFQQGR